MTRTDWDGSTIVYGWDAARGAYFSVVPGAAGQTITGDSGSGGFFIARAAGRAGGHGLRARDTAG
ncbi:hypothetical protein BJI69_03520 [Luteibacter rhizovicinus DSM 16549]|uniref:Uncharacterized protein n=1 Tax=Luteibacter rhizovicinus DSM 16549 TaxID=1440763 RepID=A0A0G9H7U1_9GAMM|nr:hypothetical protein [Luteibacter rhizovicinus]APG03065.1 hypothetical protein BJI69_03520 [Luteibacter rhizovicinus DSM 16549]KLD65556.1 hypothetical protein Y883_16375 [Luteibacter rhizovicinus DSM 16549]